MEFFYTKLKHHKHIHRLFMHMCMKFEVLSEGCHVLLRHRYETANMNPNCIIFVTAMQNSIDINIVHRHTCLIL